MDIVIWDIDAARINDIDRNLRQAMKELGLRGQVTSMSEPPLVARMGLLGKTPVLEINSLYWSLPQGEEITLGQCRILLFTLAMRSSGGPLKKT